MIEETEFKRSIEGNLKYHEERLKQIPKEAGILRNHIYAQIKAVHKVKAVVQKDEEKGEEVD